MSETNTLSRSLHDVASRVLGDRISADHAVPVSDGTRPSAATPPHVASAQKQLAVLQWAVPALTGALVVVSASAGEQQRPRSVLKGVTRRVTG